MQGKRIAILESRLGVELTGLITRAGGVPLHAPALAEVPDGDSQLLHAFFDHCSKRAPRLFIFQTGVGTRALLDMTEALGRSAELRDLVTRAQVAARGPKPAAVLRAHALRIDLITEEPHTTVQLLQAVASVQLTGERVVVQRYGESNVELEAALRARGADVVELPSYRWSLPPDTRPLARLLDAFEHNEVDAVVFTSASQARNLFEFAAQQGREARLRAGLQRAKVYSIGPVCTRALEKLAVRVDGEASPPKLGPLLTLLRERLK